VLQYVQPGLAGLMDGSVSTLAPLFAAAFATHQNWQTFLVVLAASIGAGISMGFAEPCPTTASLTGRGSPWLRGAASGIMPRSWSRHSLPYLVPDPGPTRSGRDRDRRRRRVLRIVGDRLHRPRYMDTPFLQAVFQIVLGGVIVSASHPDRRGLRRHDDRAFFQQHAPAQTGVAPRRIFWACSREREGDRRNPVYNAASRRPANHHPAASQLYSAWNQRPAVPRGLASHHSLNGTPEFAYGRDDWWEVGLYLRSR